MFCFRIGGFSPTPAPRTNRCGRFWLVLAVLMASLSPSNAQTQASIEREYKAGQTAYDDEKYDTAIVHFNRIISFLQRPDVAATSDALADAYHWRANAHYNAEHWRLAVADFNRYLELRPNDAEALSVRGVARKAIGDYDGLIADEEKATKIDPAYQDILDAAHSTVLRRQGMLGLWAIGCLVVAAGAIPFIKAILHVCRLESESRKERPKDENKVQESP